MESKLLDSSNEYRNKYTTPCFEYFVYFSKIFAFLQFLIFNLWSEPWQRNVVS